MTEINEEYVSTMLGGLPRYERVEDMDEPYRSILSKKPRNLRIIIASASFFVSLMIDLMNVNADAVKCAYVFSSFLFLITLASEWMEIGQYVGMVTSAPKGIREHPAFQQNVSALWKRAFALQIAVIISLASFAFVHLGLHHNTGPVTAVKDGVETVYDNTNGAGLGQPLLPIHDPLG